MSFREGLSDEERRAVEELRRHLGSELPEEYDDDFSMLRWLKAWDYKLDVILPRIRRTLQFRKAMGLDQVPKGPDVDFPAYLRKNFSSVIIDWYPGGMCGFDNSGNVVVIEPMGRCDPRGLAPCSRCSEFIKCRLAEAEHAWQLIRSQEKKLGKQCGVLYVNDLEGMNLDQIWMPTMQVYLTLLTHLQDHYPEMLRRLMIIRAPTIFSIGYKIVYPILSKETRRKIQIFSGDEWKSKLQSMVSSETLPIQWGGNAVGPGGTPYGPIRPAGKVPVHFRYDPKSNPEEPKPGELQQITVGRGSKALVAVDMSGAKDSALLKWFYKVEAGDVFFTIFSTAKDSGIENVDHMTVEFPRLRLNTEFVPEYGCLTIPSGKALRYYLSFDNSHSMIKSKVVQYFTKIIDVL